MESSNSLMSPTRENSQEAETDDVHAKIKRSIEKILIRSPLSTQVVFKIRSGSLAVGVSRRANLVCRAAYASILLLLLLLNRVLLGLCTARYALG